MSKSPPHQNHKLKSRYSTKSYVRQPIHQKDQENEDEIFDEEEEHESDLNRHQTNKIMYPDLQEELCNIPKYPDLQQELCNLRKQGKSFDAERKKKISYNPKLSAMPEKPDSQTSRSSIFAYAFMILLFIAAIVGFFHSPKKSEIGVTELVNDMQNHFKEQQFITFQVLKLALNRVVNVKHEPSAPAIFTIIVNKGAENTASDFSNYLANALEPAQLVLINKSAQWGNDPELLKYEIDNEIKSKLQKENLNVVIVDRFHSMPIEAAMIFHAFCDHESAPYKRAVYLFIVHLNRSIPENSSRKYLDAVAMDSLRNSWLTSSDDNVDSLITRLTGSVINIR